MTAFVLLWAGYALILVFIAKYSRSHDALLPGKVGVAVQALAYVATYISAVALVGFGGLCYLFGLQMLLVAAGNVWFGTWFVYRYLAWREGLQGSVPPDLYRRDFRRPAGRLRLGGL